MLPTSATRTSRARPTRSCSPSGTRPVPAWVHRSCSGRLCRHISRRMPSHRRQRRKRSPVRRSRTCVLSTPRWSRSSPTKENIMTENTAEGPSRKIPHWVTSRPTVTIAAAVVGLSLGVGIGSSSGDATQLASTQSQLASVKGEAAIASAQAASASTALQSAQSDAQTAKDALTSAQAGLDARKTTLDAPAAAVAAGEVKVGAAEKAAQANTFAGDGTYLVGTDVQAGTYKADASPGCYWARLSRDRKS